MASWYSKRSTVPEDTHSPPGFDQRYCFALPDCYTDAEAAPLLCAGLIGYRALDDLRLGRVRGAAVLVL